MKVKVKIRCLTAGVSGLKVGDVYEAERYPWGDYLWRGWTLSSKWFEEVKGTETIKVKCIDARGTGDVLQKGQVYDAIETPKSGGLKYTIASVRINGPNSDGWYKDRFVVVEDDNNAPTLPSIEAAKAAEPDDHTKMLNFFKPKGDAYNCGKCGGGMPCKYH